MSMTDAEIREALARAERATGGECIVRNRYSHGGGRMYREDGPARDLILDVYDEANREFYFAARTDVLRLAADLLAARAERDEARDALSTPTLAKHQPCGCVVCTCGDVERCGGCGARMCDRHRDDRPSLASDPATVWEAHPLLARAALTPPGHVLVGPECEAQIADAMGCRCHIEITRVHGFPQNHAQECDVPRVLAALGVRGGA